MVDPVSLAGQAATLLVTALSGQRSDAYLIDSVRKVVERISAREAALPPNHDLSRAVRDSLREASGLLLIHYVTQVAPDEPIWQRMVRNWQDGKREALCFDTRPERQVFTQLELLLRDDKALDGFGGFLFAESGRLLQLLDAGEAAPLAGPFNAAYRGWLAQHLGPELRAPLSDWLNEGILVEPGAKQRRTMYQLFCLFFHEKLKSREAVERIFNAQALFQIQGEIRQEGEQRAALAAAVSEATKSAAELSAGQQAVLDRLGQLGGALDTNLGMVLGLVQGHGERLTEVTGHLSAIRANTVEMMRLQRETLARVSSLAPPAASHGVAPCNIKLSAPHFAGRSVELRSLEETFARLAAQERVQVAVVWAQGGMGKTALALRFALDSASSYSATLIVGATTASALQRNFENLADDLGLEVPDVPDGKEQLRQAAVVQWLAQHPGWLLIIDGADDSAVQPVLAPLLARLASGRGRVLITSRFSDWDALAHETIQLGPLSPETCKELLHRRTKTRPRRHNDDELLTLLAKDLEGFPLAVEQACSYLTSNTDTTLEQYRTLWLAQKREVFEWTRRNLPDGSGDATPDSLVATWRTSVERFRPEARTLLRLLSFYAPLPIPRALLQAERAQHGFADAHRNDPFETEQDSQASASLQRAMGNLINYGFVQHAQDADGNAEGYLIHKIVRDITQQRMLFDSQRQGFWDAYSFLSALARPDTDTVHRAGVLSLWSHPVRFLSDYVAEHGDGSWPKIDGHALAATQVRALDPAVDAPFIESFLGPAEITFLGKAFNRFGEYAKAVAVLSLGLEQADAALRVVRLAELAECYLNGSDYARCFESVQGALSLLEGEDAERITTKADLLTTLGWCKRLMGDTRAALDAFQRAADLHERAGRRGRLVSALVGLAGTYEYRGLFADAIDCAERAVTLARELADPYALGGALYFRAWYLILAGDVQAGIADCELALSIGLQYRFEDMISESSWIRGVGHACLGAFEQALEDFERGARGSYRLVHAHATTLCGMAALRLGRRQVAHQHFQAAVELCADTMQAPSVAAFTLETLALARSGLAKLGVADAEPAAVEAVHRGFAMLDANGPAKFMSLFVDLVDPEQGLTSVRAALAERAAEREVS